MRFNPREDFSPMSVRLKQKPINNNRVKTKCKAGGRTYNHHSAESNFLSLNRPVFQNMSCSVRMADSAEVRFLRRSKQSLDLIKRLGAQ